MFDRCRTWQRRLTRRRDGTLPVSEGRALDAHLARCSRCRTAREADAAFRDALRDTPPSVNDEHAALFDRRVLLELRAEGPIPVGWFHRMQMAWSETPFGFLLQMGGGAVVAAGVTTLFLLPTLRPTKAPGAGMASAKERSARAAVSRQETPIPLESLLRSPEPRAAWLWTKPSDLKALYAPQVPPTPQRPPVKPASPAPQKRSGMAAPANLG